MRPADANNVRAILQGVAFTRCLARYRHVKWIGRGVPRPLPYPIGLNDVAILPAFFWASMNSAAEKA